MKTQQGPQWCEPCSILMSQKSVLTPLWPVTKKPHHQLRQWGYKRFIVYYNILFWRSQFLPDGVKQYNRKMMQGTAININIIYIPIIYFSVFLFVNTNPTMSVENARMAPRIYIKKLSSTPRNRDAIITPVTTYFEISNRYLPRFSLHMPSVFGMATSSCLFSWAFWFFARSRLVLIGKSR